ncbi:MAG TPA: pseudaminic acid synthase [Desulfurobacteriaceae bacterium]|nr:pseudaminic acid synthase [Desulfurobacteriaceae bacterium]
MFKKEIKIQNRLISRNSPCFIVAELSANHKQDLSLAKETLYAIKESGADAVKFQTYRPDTTTIDCRNEYFVIKGTKLWDGQTLYDLYKKAYMPWEWHYELKELAEKLGLVWFSSPFDFSAIDFLEKLNCPAYKIASFEIVDIPLIEYAAKTKKPLIISTGIARLDDIQEALDACKRQNNFEVILLKCVSDYPTDYEDINLLTLKNMAETFDCLVGLSDHSKGIEVPVAAVTLGAKLIEKHFILSKNIDTPDKEFSLTPDEFKEMVKAIRNVEKALGKVTYELTERQKKARKLARSLFVVKDVKKGETFTLENVRSIRPADGLPPKYLKLILGKKAKKDIKKGTPLSWELIDF